MNIIEKKIEEKFHICDICGYKKGFHISFIKQEESLEVVLICPNYGQQHKLNWNIILK